MRATLRVAAAALVVAAALAVDQLTKAWALTGLGATREVELGLGASLRLVFNPGVAFGIGSEVGAPLVIGIMVLTAGVLGWIATRTVQGRRTLPTVLLAVAAGGAIGNLWDRIARAEKGPLTGEDVDFIAVDWFRDDLRLADNPTRRGVTGRPGPGWRGRG